MAYRPTSLDFINRPNPVEPHTDPHKHPLHADQNHLRLLHDGNNVGPTIAAGEPPRKRRKSRDGLPQEIRRPTLPAVRQQSEKRLRIPPTLSGLHQPPPDAGVLPSISANGLRSAELPERTAVPQQQAEPMKAPVTEDERAPKRSVRPPPDHQNAEQDGTVKPTKPPAKARPTESRKNKKWTEAETKDLLKGVEKYGIGNWTKILKDAEMSFDERRTALDLKDRFRVCCPDHYKTSRKAKTAKPSVSDTNASTMADAVPAPKRTRATHEKSQADLRNLGIEGKFTKSARRKRTAYSEAEDEAILRGFRKHGQKWAQIQQDDILGLESRTPTDLRDRMRNRWPDEYAKAGLKVRRDEGRDKREQSKAQRTATNADDVKRDAKSERNEAGAALVTAPTAAAVKTSDTRLEKESKESRTAASITHTSASFLHEADDVFWGLPLDADEERVTLDRRILDWPLDNPRSTAGGHIDPIATLNLPRPSAIYHSFGGPPFPPTNSASGTLPSLATVTAGSLPFDFGEQLELPSLLEGFGALEDGSGDARAGTQLMPSLDEILG